MSPAFVLEESSRRRVPRNRSDICFEAPPFIVRVLLISILVTVGYLFIMT